MDLHEFLQHLGVVKEDEEEEEEEEGISCSNDVSCCFEMPADESWRKEVEVEVEEEDDDCEKSFFNWESLIEMRDGAQENERQGGDEGGRNFQLCDVGDELFLPTSIWNF